MPYDKNRFRVFIEKNDGEVYSQLPERKHQSFRQMLISLYFVLECVNFLDQQDIIRLRALAQCKGVIKDTADDLGEAPNTITHWLLNLEKTYEKHKKRLMAVKKKRNKQE
jgi:hypothetical protein